MNTLNIPKRFTDRFSFDSEKQYMIGCEREMFTTGKSGKIEPLASTALKVLPQDRFGYELSACQIESRLGPVHISEFKNHATEIHQNMVYLLNKVDIKTLFQTVAPTDIPFDVFPDPTGRYQRIIKNMPPHILSAACRITGTHIHVGMPDYVTALRVYNHVITKTDEFCKMGDLTNGERFSIYQIMATDFRPRSYRDWSDLYDYYVKSGYDNDPRKCWHLIRISVHGTIEFRMFDNTNNLDLITQWAIKCHSECMNALY